MPGTIFKMISYIQIMNINMAHPGGSFSTYTTLMSHKLVFSTLHRANILFIRNNDVQSFIHMLFIKYYHQRMHSPKFNYSLTIYRYFLHGLNSSFRLFKSHDISSRILFLYVIKMNKTKIFLYNIILRAFLNIFNKFLLKSR